MNFHEYQAKELFASYGIPVPGGQVARTPDEAVEAARHVGGNQWVSCRPGGLPLSLTNDPAINAPKLHRNETVT